MITCAFLINLEWIYDIDTSHLLNHTVWIYGHVYKHIHIHIRTQFFLHNDANVDSESSYLSESLPPGKKEQAAKDFMSASE